MISPQKQRFCSNTGTDCRFAACNHGMQDGMAAISPLRPAYCTQQTGGLTRGMTLRAIPASRPISSRLGLAGSGVCCNAHLDPQHRVQAATVRFRVAGPSDPSWADDLPKRGNASRFRPALRRFSQVYSGSQPIHAVAPLVHHGRIPGARRPASPKFKLKFAGQVCRQDHRHTILRPCGSPKLLPEESLLARRAARPRDAPCRTA